MNYEVCFNGVQALGGEVNSSDWFDTEREAVSFAAERLREVDKGFLAGDWLSGCVTVYHGGKIVYTADI